MASDNMTIMTQQLMSLELRNLLLTVSSSLNVSITLAGMVANSLNCLTFFKMGLNSSLKMNFFCLSLTDLVIKFIHLGLNVTMKDMARVIDLGVDLSDVAITLGGSGIGVSAFSS